VFDVVQRVNVKPAVMSQWLLTAESNQQQYDSTAAGHSMAVMTCWVAVHRVSSSDVFTSLILVDVV